MGSFICIKDGCSVTAKWILDYFNEFGADMTKTHLLLVQRNVFMGIYFFNELQVKRGNENELSSDSLKATANLLKYSTLSSKCKSISFPSVAAALSYDFKLMFTRQNKG